MFDRIRTFIEDLLDQWADRNSRIKVAKIRRVFAREGGLIDGTLFDEFERVCDHPGRCVTGALLAAAGVRDSELKLYGCPGFHHWPILTKVYGLTLNESGALLLANDSTTLGEVWARCGFKTRPEVNVRVCVVNEKLAELAAK